MDPTAPTTPSSAYRVPKYNYADQFPDLDTVTLPALRRILLSGAYVLGPEVERFERAFSDYLDVGHTVGVNSGTDALVLALDALGIGPGDEVVTVANSFHATVQAIVRLGATPVLVDCGERDFLIDLDQVAAAMTARTKAVVVVHLFGRSVDVPAVAELCRGAGAVLIEDCAQAAGARFAGVRIGTTSAAGCWSFAPAKNLAAAGDGGAVTTADTDTAARLRLLRHFGQSRQNHHELLGYNSRLDALHAFLLTEKLTRLDRWNEARVAVAAAYRERLAGLPVSFQEPGAPGEHVYHLFQLLTESQRVRDGLVDHLQSRGVDAVVRYPVPLHLQPAFASLGLRAGAFPVAEALAVRNLCLPIRPDLGADDIDFVCESVAAYFAGDRSASGAGKE
ncbi:DegT/DnrJ/EryC1/StrS family aminotransferase [Streptomyces sp. NPDC052114]|uniref:DegT/DnrJ/EryC1/StrS family aminotransferase n=1 Tax=unclassified Streptomyces TaxID=2593676 RepID=UPI003448839D